MIHIAMRTNIEINDELMANALKATGYKTKREAVEAGLRALIKQRQHEDIRALRGQLTWEGSLDDMRSNPAGIENS